MIWLILIFIVNDPIYQRPVSPAQDLATLKQELAGKTCKADQWLKKIQTYLEIDELEYSAPLLDLLTERFPSQPAFTEALMIVRSKMGRFDEALTIGEGLLHDFPNYPTTEVNLAHIYAQAKAPDKAINMMLKSMTHRELRAKDWDLVMRLLMALKGDPKQLMAQISAKITAHPQASPLTALLLAVQVRLGAFDEAMATLKANPELANHPELRSFMQMMNAFAEGTP